MSLQYLQSLTEMEPKLMWLRDTYSPPLPVAKAFMSPKCSVFANSASSSVRTTHNSVVNDSSPLVDEQYQQLIDLSKCDDRDNSEGCSTTSSNLVVKASNDPPLCTHDSNPVQTDTASLRNKSPTMDIPASSCTTLSAGDNLITGIDEVSADGAAVIPASRREYEKSMYDTLKVLYTEAFKLPFKEVEVGGRVVQLDSFHYIDSSNSCQPEQ